MRPHFFVDDEGGRCVVCGGDILGHQHATLPVLIEDLKECRTALEHVVSQVKEPRLPCPSGFDLSLADAVLRKGRRNE